MPVSFCEIELSHDDIGVLIKKGVYKWPDGRRYEGMNISKN